MTESSDISFKKIKTISKETTVSTNTDAREIIKISPDEEYILVTAKEQTGGRGRQGKSFLSPRGGLYMTLAMRCGLPISSAVSSTSCAAVAVCRAIEKISGINCGIKWVNDIFIGSGKLAGILVESVNDYSKMTSEYLIIGVGVNIESSPQIVDSSYGTTCLLDHGVSISADSLCHEIVRQFIEIRKNNFDFSKYLDEYTSKSIVIGKSVSFIHNGKELTGTAVGINSCGGLILNSNNRVITLDSGEISIKLRP